jgi:ligand-binding sensor domain-containing protein
MRTNLSLYIVLLFQLTIFAQQENGSDTAQLFYRHFTVQNGLPSNEAYFGYQDKAGYIWICTDNGVSKFDGIQFKNYNNAEGLRSNVIFGCKEDPKGNLWMYSFAGELYRYQPLTDNFESPSFNDSLARLLAGRSILNLVFEKDTIYVMTLNAYVKLVLPTHKSAKLELVEGQEQTLTARILSNGEVLVTNTTEENVTRFNLEVIPANSTTSEVIKNIPIFGLVQQHLSSIILGEKLYVVFGENILTYNFKTKLHTMGLLPFSHLAALKKSSVGVLSGSYSKGLWLLNEFGESFAYKQLIKNRNISSSFEDKQGGIWACSQTDGVYFVPNRTTLSFQKNEELASRRVTSLFTIGNKAFYMTYGGALFEISLSVSPVQKNLIEAGQYNMRAMKPFGKDEILLLAGRNLKYTISTGKISGVSVSEICGKESDIEQSIISSRKNQLFFLSCEGYWQKENIISNQWEYGKVFIEAIGDKGKMWLATSNDLIFLDTLAHTIVQVGKKNGLRNFSVKFILPLGKDSIMVASNQGVHLIVKDEIRKSYTLANGLSSDRVLTLFPLDGDLWVGTSEGIDKIVNYKSELNNSVISVTGHTGFSKCPVTHFASLGNYVLAGTDEGVCLFDRKQLFKRAMDVKPVVIGLMVNEVSKITDLSSELELKYNENSLDIYFNALNYRNSLSNKYRYRLKTNNNVNWSYTSQNHVLFPLLTPGIYIFELQAMNPDGGWSKTISEFSFVISKPFWQTWWFIAMLILSTGFAVYLFFAYRIRQMQMVGNLTGELSEAKMQTLGMQLNPDFVFNALSSVSFFMAKNDSKATLKLLEKFANLMRLVFKNSQYPVVSLEDELKALNLYIELESVRLGKEFGFAIDIETINVAECKVPALLLQPFVENAIWHGIGTLNSGTGKLQLIFMRVGDTLQIEIIDNGIGRYNAGKIKPKDNKRIHSIDIIKERLNLLRTKYNSYTHLEITNAYEDLEFCGTKVLIIIPWLSDSEMRGKDKILKRFIFDDHSAYN